MNIYSNRNTPHGFYIYAYLRQSNFSPYYIGKGSGNRAWQKKHSVVVPKDNNRIVIMEESLTEIGAFSLERMYIRWYGRKDNGTGILRNLTDGGEGSSGYITPEKTKKLISLANKGKIGSQLQKKVAGENMKNIISIVKTCEKCGKQTNPPNYKRWHGDNCGVKFKHSEETKNKIKKTSKGRLKTKTQIQAVIESNQRRKGKKYINGYKTKKISNSSY